jgi:diguanylate cyclase (GGDEF)-like protein/PAS domain S-box-containing protein
LYEVLELDIRTLILSYGAALLVCIFLVGHLAGQYKQRRGGLRFWLMAFVMQFVAILLVVLHGKLPTLLTVVASGLASVFGVILLSAGLQRFSGAASRWGIQLPLFLIFGCIHTYFGLVEPNLGWRSINFAAFSAFFCGQIAWQLLVEASPEQYAGTRPAGIVMSGYVLLHLTRIAAYTQALPLHDFLHAGNADAIVILCYELLAIALAFSLMLMVNHRLRVELNSELEARIVSEQNTHDSEARLVRAELIGKTGNWALRLDTSEIVSSAGAQQIYGLYGNTFSYQRVKEMPLPEYRPILDDALNKMLKEDRPYDVEFRIRAADSGEVKHVHSIASYDRSTNTIFGVLQDVTQIKVTEAAIQLAAKVFSHTREGVAIADSSGNLIEVNDAFSRITGYSRDEVIGKNPRILNSGRQDKAFYADMWLAINTKGYWSGELWNRHKSGAFYAEMLSVSVVRDSSGAVQNYVGLMSDVTANREHQAQLVRIAHYDSLTGMPNRILLADRLSQALLQSQRRERAMVVAYLDLDGFKAINDTHGHEVGDQLLIEVANRMKEALREGDTLSRLGGDEFVALLVDLEQPTECDEILKRLLVAASSVVATRAGDLNVTASIGVTIYPQDGQDAEILLRHADQAMYLAKQSGKNRYHLFDVNQDTTSRVRRERLNEIGAALVRREFVLFYQPKVNMKTGEVIGVEALIRWQHPVRGLLLPSEFLPIVENNLLETQIGDWVIRSAAQQVNEWRSCGVQLQISVNISAQHLLQKDFAEKLERLMQEYPELPSGSLELEILETSALEDLELVAKTMQSCRRIGIGFALDDFGTGYSSLAYLKKLRSDLIKIDQSFVRDMLVDPDDLAIIGGVIGLAKAFDLRVIAEGVETMQHGIKLLSMGCPLAQGYGVKKPMPAGEVLAWIESWTPFSEWLEFSK